MIWKKNQSACDQFTKNKERIKKIKETGDSRCIYQNELDKACFQHDLACGDFKDLNRRTTADNVLFDKAFNIAKNPRCDGYQCGLWSVTFLIKKVGGVAALSNKFIIKIEIISNKELAEELHKLIIRKFNKRKVQSPFFRQYFGCRSS